MRTLLGLLLPVAVSLRSVRLSPDGTYAAANVNEPVRFSFAPESENSSAYMQEFTIRVWTGDVLVAHHRVQSSAPTTTLKIEPGRYSWSVQWRSCDGIVSDVAFSQVVVASGANIWEGVPWLGASGSNEFSATIARLPIGKPIELMASTLGFGYVSINGKEISDDLLSYSGWTNTEKRVLYRMYDITELVGKDGLAVLHVALGCGYRCDPRNRFPAYLDTANRSHDTIPRIFRLQIWAEKTRVFHSGSKGWFARQGPVTEDSVYGGETYDPTAVTAWSPVKQLPSGWGPKGTMVAATFPGVQVTRKDVPLKITQPAPGVHVVDFGSNVAGVCQIRVPKVPLPAQATCAMVPDAADLSVSCGGTGSIRKVAFASFGTPIGSCSTGFSQSFCHAATTQAMVEKNCLGRGFCTLKASRDNFGDPCNSTLKQLAVQVECASVPASGPSPLGSVSLKHGEIMQHAHLPDLKSPDPSRVYFGNLRSAEATDTLYLETPVESWSPRFTYHGFRYVEVYNYPGELTKGSIQRLVMNTAVPEQTSISFGNEVLQAIYEGSKGSQKSNLMQIPTDCPQRDERLGWMGDMSLSAQSMLVNFDMKSMASAFVNSMVDEMSDDGSFPDVVPFQRFGGRPADLSWSAAFLSTLTSLWQEAGDLMSAQKHWAAVKTHVGYLQAQFEKAGSFKSLPEPYGDWCPPPNTPGKTDQERPSRGFAAAFSLIRAIQQASDLGVALGGDAAKDAKVYEQIAATLRKKFHDTFYDASKKQYDNGVMVTNVLPLALNAVPISEHSTVIQNLLNHIASKNGTWSGGIINNRFLFDVLHNEGFADVALLMLKRRTYPSYGYMYFNDLEPARECMWELPDAPFQGTGMNSRNHHMYSSVGHYLSTRVAGLSRGPRDGEFTAVVGSEESSSATVRTYAGDLKFTWSRVRGIVEVNALVPISLKLRLHVPEASGELRSAERKKSMKVEIVQLYHSKFKMIVLGSGQHRFTTAPEKVGLTYV